MNGPRTLALAAALAALPLAHQDGVSGIPKTYCEGASSDRQVHDYAGPGLFPWITMDGSVPGSCSYDPDWDHHYEFTLMGAFLNACDGACGPNGHGEGALACGWGPADHPAYPTVWVRDVALPSGVGFTVSADLIENLPRHDDPYCGDFESDTFVSCVDVCTVPFPPGFDGSYAVVVEGTAGHVQTVDPATYPPAWP